MYQEGGDIDGGERIRKIIRDIFVEEQCEIESRYDVQNSIQNNNQNGVQNSSRRRKDIITHCQQILPFVKY